MTVSSRDETSVPLLTPDIDNDARDEYELDERPKKGSKFEHSGPVPEPRGSRLDVGPSSSRYQRRTPLPLGQIVCLCVVRLAEPIAYTQIFPYINQMMEYLKVTDRPSEIGYYSGIVDSIFAVCQLFTVLHWGRLSDRIGRKPVILGGLVGVAISSLLFGFSQSLWWAVISRSLAGALSGNVAVVQTVIGEITDESNQAQAFPLTGLSWSLGCILGPMMGGNLVNPAINFPNTLGKLWVFQEYPFLLPCMVASICTLVSIAFGFYFLKETLPSKVRLDPTLPSPIVASAIPSREKKSSPPPMREVPISEIMASSTIRSIFKNYFLLSILMTAFDVVFILLAYTPIHLGGLSRAPEEIGYALAISGIAGAIAQVIVFPYLQHKYDSIPLYRFLMCLWPVVYAMLPLLNVIARWTMAPDIPRTAVLAAIGDIAGNSTMGVPTIGEIGEEVVPIPASAALWFAIAVLLAVVRVAAMSFSLNVILIKNAAPSREALGATFGLSQTVACVARSGAPAFVSTMFALSKKYQLLGGNFVWLVMFIISLIGLWSTYKVKDGAVERSYKREDAEESEMRLLR